MYWCKSLFLVSHFSVVEWDNVYSVTLCFGGMILRMSVSFLSVLVECISLSFPSVPLERARSGGWRRPAPTDQSLPVHVPRGEQQGGAGHQEQPPVHGEAAHTDHRGPRPRQAQGSVPNTCTYIAVDYMNRTVCHLFNDSWRKRALILTKTMKFWHNCTFKCKMYITGPS